jgi:DnaJ-class molecular chaperone
MDTSPREIYVAYKNLVKKWHPDKHPPSSRLEAEAHFKAISEAYEVSAETASPTLSCRARIPD